MEKNLGLTTLRGARTVFLWPNPLDTVVCGCTPPLKFHQLKAGDTAALLREVGEGGGGSGVRIRSQVLSGTIVAGLASKAKPKGFLFILIYL